MDILGTLTLLCPQPPIEVRAAVSGAMKVQRFGKHADAARWAQDLAREAKAVYVAMNAFDESLIRGTAVNDEAVTRRRWLLVDVDPQRPKDMNSTRAELEMSASTAAVIEAYLAARGFPLPVRAISGNGVHLLYPIDLPNDAESDALVTGVLKHLAAEFDSDQINIDTTVSNAARITKLYGTTARKGPSQPDRPQRMSRITRVPEPLTPVSKDLLAAVAALVPKPEPPSIREIASGEYDLGQVFARVAVQRTFTKDGSTWHVIRCPWSYEHSSEMEDEATVVTVGPGGGLGFRCLHAHCEGRKWEDFRNHLGLETRAWQERRRRSRRGSKAEPERPKRSPNRVTVAARERMPIVLSRMDRYASHGAMPGALDTGMRRLNGMLLGGLRPQKFYVLGGESGRGKTTLLMQWAFHIAPKVAPRVVGIVTPEMDADSLDERAFSQISGTGVGEYRRWPQESRAKWEQIQAPQNVRASFDPSDIRAFVEEEKPALFIVDYAQQAVSYEAERRHTALAALGAECLDIAKSAGIPVVLGTQVNVTADRDFSVRETRIIEHQADVIMFIDVQYEKVTPADGLRQVKPGAALVVEKNRHGSAGRIPIKWEQHLFRFEEL